MEERQKDRERENKSGNERERENDRVREIQIGNDREKPHPMR